MAMIVVINIIASKGFSQVYPSATFAITSEIGTFAASAGVDYYATFMFFGLEYKQQIATTTPNAIMARFGGIINGYHEPLLMPYVTFSYPISRNNKYDAIRPFGAGLRYHPINRAFYFLEYGQSRIYLGFAINFKFRSK